MENIVEFDNNPEKNDLIELESNLDKIERTVFRKYLYNVSDEFSVLPFDVYNVYKNSGDNDKDTNRIVLNTNIKCIHIKRWTYDKKEQIIDRFSNVYSAFSQRKDALALVLNRTVEGTDLYFVVRTDSMLGASEITTSNMLKLLKESLKGNFPGTVIEDVSSVLVTEDNKDLDIWKMANRKAVSAVTSISSDKSEKHISQGIEKILNGIVPKKEEESYTIVFLAEPISHNELLSIKNGYESLASSISGFSEYQSNLTLSQMIADGTSWTSAHTMGTNRSISKTQGFNVGINATINSSSNQSKSESSGWLYGIVKNLKKATTNVVGSMLGVSGGINRISIFSY